MGWAIRRGDGSYRCWNRNAQDDTLRAGEAWTELDTPPTLTPDVATDAEKTAAAAGQADVALMKAVTLTLLDVIDARHPANPVDRAAFRQAVITRLKALI